MNKYKIQIISHSNEIVVEKDVAKYEKLTENSIAVYDTNEKKTTYLIGMFLVIIEELNNEQ